MTGSLPSTPLTDDIDEFSFLPAQAGRLGVAPLPARREQLGLPDGRSLSAIRYGEGAPRAVLLHGAGLNAHTWDATVLAFGEPALAIDLAGHGDSSWREDADYAPHTLRADIETALEHWTTGPVVLIGHSLGGLTAVATAARRPDLVRALIVVDIVPGIDRAGGPAQLRRFYEKVEFDSRDELVDHALAFGFGGARERAELGVFFNSRVRDDGRVEWKHHFARIANAMPASSDRRSGSHEEYWPDLEAVRAPFTLVRASRGFISDDNVADFRSHVPHAQVIDLDSPHNVQEEQPAALAALIRSLAD